MHARVVIDMHAAPIYYGDGGDQDCAVECYRVSIRRDSRVLNTGIGFERQADAELFARGVELALRTLQGRS